MEVDWDASTPAAASGCKSVFVDLARSLLSDPRISASSKTARDVCHCAYLGWGTADLGSCMTVQLDRPRTGIVANGEWQ